MERFTRELLKGIRPGGAGENLGFIKRINHNPVKFYLIFIPILILFLPLAVIFTIGRTMGWINES